jgi:hypothetical protein
MKNYNIEGNIDFFSELYKSLDIDENESKTEEDENLCLITNEELKDYFVKLSCGHKFNYIPLYNDIKNHKNKFNYLEGKISHLKIDEIRCPYCRNKQNELLPYHEELGLAKIHGVNFIDDNKKNNQKIGNIRLCEYLIPNKNFDPNQPTDDNTNHSLTNCKFFKCNSSSFYQISKFIEGYEGQEQYFCYSHKNKKIKENNKIIKNKENEEINKAKEKLKIKLKEEKQKIKEDLKIKLQEEKQKIKEEKQTNKNLKKIIKDKSENVVLGPVNITHIECIEILKSGPKKGTKCSFKAYDESYCKRHMKNKIQEIQEIQEI